MPSERERKTKANPLPKWDEFFTKISDVSNRLRYLRKRGRSAADPLSAGRFAALVQVDLIASVVGLQRQVDELAFLLLAEECSVEERTRRLKCLIRMTGRIQVTILEAIHVYLDCFGGPKAIAIQATTQWMTELRARSPADSAAVDAIMKAIIEKSVKKT